MLRLNFPRHKKATKTFKYNSLEGLRIMHVILKTFPKSDVKIEPSSIAWLLKKDTHTHTHYTLGASVLFSQYLISRSREEG